jgi:hypothetical protein
MQVRVSLVVFEPVRVDVDCSLCKKQNCNWELPAECPDFEPIDSVKYVRRTHYIGEGLVDNGI